MKFPSIESYSKAIKSIRNHLSYDGKDDDGNPIYCNMVFPIITFVGTTKLHGTNSGIHFKIGEGYTCLSRNRELSIDNDNYGFAKFIEAIGAANLLDFVNLDGVSDVYLFGEWVGPGIQSKVAVSNLFERRWFVFAMKVVTENYDFWMDPPSFPVDRVHNIYNYGKFEVNIDLNFPRKAQDEINKLTNAVVDECPVGKVFGINGVGEGIVWYPKGFDNRYKFAFKTKGDKHSETNPKPARMKEPIPESVHAFVDTVLTGERFQQGLDTIRELNGRDADVEDTGAFLSWLVKDVLREEELGNLNEKQVKSALSCKARIMFLKHVTQL